jgi:hypothetical protein
MLLGKFVVALDFVLVSVDALEPGPAPVSGFAGFIAVALLVLFAPADGFIAPTPGPLAESVLGAPGAEPPTGPELAPKLVLVDPDEPIAPMLVPALAAPPAACANAFDVNAPSASDSVTPSRIEDAFFFFIIVSPSVTKNSSKPLRVG